MLLPHRGACSAEEPGRIRMSIKGLALCGAALILVSGVALAQNSNDPNQPMQPGTSGPAPTTPTMDPNATTSPAVNPPGSTPGSNAGGNVGGTTNSGSMGNSAPMSGSDATS